MSEVVRLYRHRSLRRSEAVSADDLMATLEVARATLKRVIAKLRDQLHVPISFDRDRDGYVLEAGQNESELPRFWFSQEEILALITIQPLLEQLGPGLLGNKLKPLQSRLTHLMDKHGLASQDVAKRIRIVHARKRVVQTKSFEAVAAATMARKRIKILHFNRRNGIFTGAAEAWAKLRFTPERARWVAGENWHPMQESSFDAAGSYLLSFPYADDRELSGDIMRYGADVQVLAPAALKNKVQKGFWEAAAKYV